MFIAAVLAFSATLFANAGKLCGVNDCNPYNGCVDGCVQEGGDSCPSNSDSECREKAVGEACTVAQGGSGSCGLTPLTAGGFCLCFESSGR
jgi:hypothetical protein